jgi:hypothetical protein
MNAQSYPNKERFYATCPKLRKGRGNLEHTGAPAGLGTAFEGIRRENHAPLETETWSVIVACSAPDSHTLVRSSWEGRGGSPVPGAVVAVSSETGEILVLWEGPDARPAFAAIRELETGDRHPRDFTLEDLARAVQGP